MTPELMIVMPVYNEQASVRKVVLEWFHEVENWTEDFIFLAVNDGSTDGTVQILARLGDQLGPRFEVLEQKNMGHGQSCLAGYRAACRRNVPFVFQIDSDGQCDPQYFFRFWREREKFDVIYGQRKKRNDGWRRVIASHILRATLLISVRVNCIDANVPYRLMRTARLQQTADRIGPDFFLANIALAVLLKRDPAWRHGSVAISFRQRFGGEPSVPFKKFGVKATELHRQLRSLLQYPP